MLQGEYKDLAKFAEDTDSHLFGKELEDSVKKAKGRHYSLQALSPKTNNPRPSAKRKFHEIPKNDMPTKRPMTGHKGSPYSHSNGNPKSRCGKI